MIEWDPGKKLRIACGAELAEVVSFFAILLFGALVRDLVMQQDKH